jgi:hypothetical protein
MPHAQVISRAMSEGVQVMLAYTNDSDKTEQLVRVAKENLGTIYTMVGFSLLATSSCRRGNWLLCALGCDGHGF